MTALLAALLLPAAAALAAPKDSPVPLPVAQGTPGLDEPVNVEVYHQADQLYLHRDRPGAPERERALLEKTLAVSPLDAGLLWRYGRARVEVGERARGWGRGEHFVEAEQALLAALAIDPDLVEAHYWLAKARCEHGHYRQALAAVDAALKLAPDDARLHQLAGDIRWRAPRLLGGDRQAAVQEYQKALTLSPRFAEDYVSLAEAYADMGLQDEAVAVLDRMDRQTDIAPPGLAGSYRDRALRLRRRLGH